MEQIYLIEDINGLKYVGRTKQTLNTRLGKHKYDKKINYTCSSKELDLDNCKITCIDIADSRQEARELEDFYINSIDCVNLIKYNYDHKEYYQKNKDKRKEYQQKYDQRNKDKINERSKKYREKNKDKVKQYQRKYREKKKKSQIQL